jgi:hypothetical protein
MGGLFNLGPQSHKNSVCSNRANTAHPVAQPANSLVPVIGHFRRDFARHAEYRQRRHCRRE